MSKDIEEIARAISRAMSVDLHGGQLTDYSGDDWEDFVGEAQAAYSVMEKRLGELEEALDNLTLSADRVANKYGRDPETDELLDWTEWQDVRDDVTAAHAALIRARTA